MEEAPNQTAMSSPLSDPFSKPRPRVPRSPAQAAHVRRQNRRQEYLERHPSYFKSLEHELADPILYDALIRRFQTPEERENEGKSKGYSRVLEVDLLRGEAKLSRLADERSQSSGQHQGNGAVNPDNHALRTPPEEAKTKDEGRQMWDDYLRERFVSGQDEDFDYDVIDADDSLDVLERRDEEDAWFNDEEPGWASDKDSHGNSQEKLLHGETGVQDF